LKESTERGDGNPEFCNGPVVGKTQRFAYEPSRQIPTAIASLISGEERNMLEYVYTPPKSLSWAEDPAWHYLYKRLIFNYGFSIEFPSVRFGMLARSAASQFRYGIGGNEDRIDEYLIRGCQALRNKIYTEFDVEEMFTMLFLIQAENDRYAYYVSTGRSNSDHLKALTARLVVHVRGMHSLLKGFGDRLRAATAERFGKEVWELVVNYFANYIGYSDGMDLLSQSSFYRQQISEMRDCHHLVTRWRDSALGNTVAGLVKKLLQGCMDGAMVAFRTSLEEELEGYLSLYKMITLSQPMMTSETPSRMNWRTQKYLIMQHYAGKIILHLSKKLAVSFTWVQEVVSAALSLHEQPVQTTTDQNAAVLYVLKAALVIPLAKDFPCNFPVLGFLINHRSKKGDRVSGKSWEARRV